MTKIQISKRIDFGYETLFEFIYSCLQRPLQSSGGFKFKLVYIEID